MRVVVFTGLPGTGKSTLAEEWARRSGVPAFAGDWLLGALAPLGLLTGVERATHLGAYRGLLGVLVTRQLMLGQSAILDCLFDGPLAERVRADADRYGARLVVVECVCRDESLHRARVESRHRGIPGWHEIGWDHVERMRAEYRPPADPDLVLDATDPLADNLRRLTAAL